MTASPADRYLRTLLASRLIPEDELRIALREFVAHQSSSSSPTKASPGFQQITKPQASNSQAPETQVTDPRAVGASKPINSGEDEGEDIAAEDFDLSEEDFFETESLDFGSEATDRGLDFDETESDESDSDQTDPKRTEDPQETFQALQTVEVDRLGMWLIERGLITEWQHAKLVRGRHQGFFLGKYKLLSRLGRGGMATVYLAEHTRLKRQVAIKALPPERVRTRSYLRRFLREARAIATLDHPNIVHAYEVDNEGDLHYIVMEFIEGIDLDRLVRKGKPLNPRVAADYIRQAAQGLAHAHQRGLIHRDVKPANLLVDREGTVKILDLGLAQVTALGAEAVSAVTLECGDSFIGTTDYMAPEQARNSHKVDFRADMYSLGCTFYFLLSGQAPFAEGTLAERLLKHQTTEPELLSSLRRGIPEELARFCGRLMAKRPEDRFGDMTEVADLLEGWLAGKALPLPFKSLRAESLQAESLQAESLQAGQSRLAAIGSASTTTPSVSSAPGLNAPSGRGRGNCEGGPQEDLLGGRGDESDPHQRDSTDFILDDGEASSLFGLSDPALTTTVVAGPAGSTSVSLSRSSPDSPDALTGAATEGIPAQDLSTPATAPDTSRPDTSRPDTSRLETSRGVVLPFGESLLASHSQSLASAQSHSLSADSALSSPSSVATISRTTGWPIRVKMPVALIIGLIVAGALLLVRMGILQTADPITQNIAANSHPALPRAPSVLSDPRKQQATVFRHLSPWRGRLRSLWQWPLAPDQLTAANQIVQRPSVNEKLGSVLSFSASRTGLPSGFSLTTTAPDGFTSNRLVGGSHQPGGSIQAEPEFSGPASVAVGPAFGKGGSADWSLAFPDSDYDAVGVLMVGRPLGRPGTNEGSFQALDASGNELLRGRVAEPISAAGDLTFLGIVTPLQPISELKFGQSLDSLGIVAVYLGRSSPSVTLSSQPDLWTTRWWFSKDLAGANSPLTLASANRWEPGAILVASAEGRLWQCLPGQSPAPWDPPLDSQEQNLDGASIGSTQSSRSSQQSSNLQPEHPLATRLLPNGTFLLGAFADGTLRITPTGLSTQPAAKHALSTTVILADAIKPLLVPGPGLMATFRPGVDGYDGSLLVSLDEGRRDRPNLPGAEIRLSQRAAASSGGQAHRAVQALLRFGGIFGSQPGQIPRGSQILSATLTLKATKQGHGFAIHRMLREWSSETTWDSFGGQEDDRGGVEANDIEAVRRPDAATSWQADDGPLHIDVTPSVAAWALEPTSNYGWLLQCVAGSDAWGFASDQSDGAQPALTVEFLPPAGPSGIKPTHVPLPAWDVSENSRWLATSFVSPFRSSCTLKLWEIQGNHQQTIATNLEKVTALGIHRDGSWVAAAGRFEGQFTVQAFRWVGGVVRCWSHAAPVTALAWSPDGVHLASGGLDGSLRYGRVADQSSSLPAPQDLPHHVYHLDTPIDTLCFAPIDPVSGQPRSPGFSMSGSRMSGSSVPGSGNSAAPPLGPVGRLALATRGGQVRIYDLPADLQTKPQEIQRFNLQTSPADPSPGVSCSPDPQRRDCQHLAFTPDGRQLIAVTREGRVVRWSLPPAISAR